MHRYRIGEYAKSVEYAGKGAFVRKPIEKLARELSSEPHDSTCLELSHKYAVPIERIMDAMAVLKILEAFGALESKPITYISF